jgi:hypothetical protein
VPLLWELRLEVSMCSENVTQKPVIASNKYRARHIKDIGNVVQSTGRLKKLVILLDWDSRWSTKPWIATSIQAAVDMMPLESFGSGLTEGFLACSEHWREITDGDGDGRGRWSFF